MKVVLVGGTTETATIDHISAAGASRDLLVHTPSADLEIATYGRPIRAPVVPVSPSGCPTPAVITRAVRELVEFDLISIDAGLARRTDAPTVAVDCAPGGDIRTSDPVPEAREIFETARTYATRLPDSELVIGETIPGGTTTALGVLLALGERPTVSSSLPQNPLARKRDVVTDALAASDLRPGGAGPLEAVRRAGDPVLATVAGVIAGATDSGIDVTLAGGTQLAAAAAIARHVGISESLTLATTSFIAGDDTASIGELAADLDLTLRVTDPGFEGRDHPMMNAYTAGEAKEGVGMGGALAIADRAGIPTEALHERSIAVYDRLLETEQAVTA